jgi:hypothetical protein
MKISADYKFGDFKVIKLTDMVMSIYEKVRINEKLELILLLQNDILKANIELLKNINYFALYNGKNFFVVRINFLKEKIYEVRFYSESDEHAIIKLKQFLDSFDFTSIANFNQINSNKNNSFIHSQNNLDNHNHNHENSNCNCGCDNNNCDLDYKKNN